VPTFAQRGVGDERAAGASRRGPFGAAQAEAGLAVGLQGPQPHLVELTADLVDPEGVLAREEAALGHEHGDE
jgi:hypothetical protein